MDDVTSENEKKHGLIIDDENIVIIFLRRLLEKWNFNADYADNALDALTAIAANKYDFILMDVRMPDISGLVLYKKIEELKPELAKRIIFVTGDTAGKDTLDLLRTTGIYCVPKPIDQKKLKATIEKVLESGKNAL
jgi:DNA-binding NtrC family response regulator